jgi:hypothetical protein
VRSVRVVELLMSMSTVENIVGAGLKRMPFPFSVEPYVVKRIKLYYFALLPNYKIFPTSVNHKNSLRSLNKVPGIFVRF